MRTALLSTVLYNMRHASYSILLVISGALLSNVMMTDKRFRRLRENAIKEAVPR
jgi:hypothetical protein